MTKTKQMNKKKRALLILLPLMALLFLLLPDGETVYGISEGTYEMVTEEGAQLTPILHFDMNDKGVRFVLSADRRISLAYSGNVTCNGRISAIASNGEDKWIFETIDNDTLVFVQRGSSDVYRNVIPDGAVFQYVREE